MRLLPAFIFVIIIFLAGLFFLQARRVSHSAGGFPSGPSGQMRKTALSVAAIALLLLFGALFLFLGKIALVIAFVTLALFFLTRGKGL